MTARRLSRPSYGRKQRAAPRKLPSERLVACLVRPADQAMPQGDPGPEIPSGSNDKGTSDMKRSLLTMTSAMTVLVATTASAEITGAYVVEYSVTAADFDGSEVTVNVQDLYLAANDLEDNVSGISGFTMADAGRVNYFQSPGSTWLALNSGGPFDSPALRQADSFVTIGGFEQGVLTPGQAPGAGGNPLLSFDSEIPYPGEFDGGWFNIDIIGDSNRIGEVAVPDADGAPSDFGFGLFLGRFAYEGEFSIVGSEMTATWFNGLGGPIFQSGFTVAPAPGALGFFAVAGLRRRPRRG